MLTVNLITSEGVEEKAHLAGALELAQAKNGILWVDLRAYTDEEIALISKPFNLHQIESESLKETYTRPHLYEYKDHFHANFTYIDTEEDELQPKEFHIFLAQNYIITAGTNGCCHLVDQAIRLYCDMPELVEKGSYYALYLVVDLLTDTYIHSADELDDQVDNIEDQMTDNADRSTLQQLFQIKRKLFNFRRYMAPQRDVFNELARGTFKFIANLHEPYFQDVYNRMSQVFDIIDTSRDILSGTLDLYQSSVSNRLNDIMKILTVFAVILGIFSLITGYFGMNLANFPKLSVWTLAGWSLFILAAVTAALLYWFKKKGWL